MALESRSPPQRHHHRGPRPGDRQPSADEAATPTEGMPRAFVEPRRDAQDHDQRGRTPHPRRARLHPGVGTPKGDPDGARLRLGLGAHRWCRRCDTKCGTPSVRDRSQLLREMAHGGLWGHAARRPRRGHPRSPPEQPHGADEPPAPLSLLEHELPHRAPHVPDRAVPRACRPP